MADVPTGSELAAYTDAEFAQLQAAMAAEQQRRYVLAQAIATGTAMAQQYQDAGGDPKAAWAQILANLGIDPSAIPATTPPEGA